MSEAVYQIKKRLEIRQRNLGSRYSVGKRAVRPNIGKPLSCRIGGI